ncbi:DUF4870 domain-containing protein [Candidatus Dependentiae bacterium]|nr:DUF4870 domain-containing protein [Candidatus Dependentiae bacterium]
MKQQISKSDRILAMITHLTSLVGSFIIPLIIFLLKKDESRFIDCNSREVINAHINAIVLCIGFLSISILMVGTQAGPISGFLALGFIVMLPVIAFVYTVSFIVGAIKAYNGKCFRYPVVFKLLVKRDHH